MTTAKTRITVVSGAHLTALDRKAAATMIAADANSASTPRKHYRLGEADEQGRRELTQSYVETNGFGNKVTRTDRTIITAK